MSPESTTRRDGSGKRRRADAVRNEGMITVAAMRVLAEHPGASMAQIADASGLGRATLYRHFASREELVTAIQRQAMEAGARALAAAELDRGSAVEGLRRAITALVGVGDRYRLLGREAALDPGMLQRQPDVAGKLLELVRRGQRAGELRDDLPPSWIVPALAALLVLALRAMAEQHIGQAEAAERVAATLLEGLAAPVTSPAERRPLQAPDDRFGARTGGASGGA